VTAKASPTAYTVLLLIAVLALACAVFVATYESALYYESVLPVGGSAIQAKEDAEKAMAEAEEYTKFLKQSWGELGSPPTDAEPEPEPGSP